MIRYLTEITENHIEIIGQVIHDTTPEYDYDQGDGNWEVSAYDFSLSEGVGVDGLLDASAYYPDTGFDEYIKGMKGIFGRGDKRSDAEKEALRKKGVYVLGNW